MGKLLFPLILFMALLCATPARAADTRAHLLLEIDSAGLVSVTQRWSGLGELERLRYDTGTAELGVLEAPVQDGNAVLEYASQELLHTDGDRLRLIIARLENGGDWLDFDITLRYPGNLEFINSDPPPSFTSSVARGLMWSLADERELILSAVFRRYQSGTGGSSGGQDEHKPDSANGNDQGQGSNAGILDSRRAPQEADPPQNDNAAPVDVEPQLAPAEQLAAQPSAESSGPELLLDGDPLLMEFQLLINAARREGKGDEDFLAALEKLLMKFYYLLDAMGAGDEYEP